MARDIARYSLLLNTEVGDENDGELVKHLENIDSEAPFSPTNLRQKIVGLEVKEAELQKRLDALDKMWESRRLPLLGEIHILKKRKEQWVLELETAEEEAKEIPSPPPGPRHLSCVDGTVFGCVCHVVVILNLMLMALEIWHPHRMRKYQIFDHLFLLWYVLELVVKALYFQHELLIGRCTVVWWNWLDVIIVMGGVVDQWMLPVITATMPTTSVHHGGGFRALRFLWLCRVMRCLRVLRVVKVFRQMDLSWTDGPRFESFILSIIALNAVLMGLELDIPWAGWQYVEHGFLVIYTFELVARLKRWGCRFFVAEEVRLWNNIDFLIVSAGITDLWMLPVVRHLSAFLTDAPVPTTGHSLGGALTIMRMMRLLRVLRLVRLLRSVKPLYRLLMGVISALQAMQWVLILTVLVLYGAALVFTSLVGHGYLYGGNPPAAAMVDFGSVPESLFSLFKLMNGDLSVVEPICGTVMGRLLFAVFMILANWAILAILTSVVSDHMISMSQQTDQEDYMKQADEADRECTQQLMNLFMAIDKDCSGGVTEDEWNELMKDPKLCDALCKASKLPKGDLQDLFICLSSKVEHNMKGRLLHSSGRVLDYENFIFNLKDESKAADRRSVLHLMSCVRSLEISMEQRFNEMAARLDELSPGETRKDTRKRTVQLNWKA